MTKEEYMAIAATKYEGVAKLKACDNLYDMEKGLVEVLNELGQMLLQETLGDAGNDRRKKKVRNAVREGRNSPCASV